MYRISLFEDASLYWVAGLIAAWRAAREDDRPGDAEQPSHPRHFPEEFLINGRSIPFDKSEPPERNEEGGATVLQLTSRFCHLIPSGYWLLTT